MKRKTIPAAPQHISRAINQLAGIRAMMKTLAARSQKIADPIIKHGSCHNDRRRAYVTHISAATRISHSKARDCVILKPMPKAGK